MADPIVPQQVGLEDGNANLITSQVSGSQRALDVGINVAGVQVDPRTSIIRITSPSAGSDGAQAQQALNEFGVKAVIDLAPMLAEWGKNFSATTNFVSTGATTQQPLLLFRNPSGSGVNCKIKKFVFTGAGGTFRVYQDPTVTTNGTSVAVSGNRQTSQATGQALLTTLPTVTANGTIFKSFIVASQSILLEDWNYSRWLEPNHSLLVTIAQSGASTAGSIDIEWAEQ